MQQLGKRNIDDSFIGTRIEYSSEFDLVGEENMQELRWCGDVLKEISDGTWVKPGKRRQYYKEQEAAFLVSRSFEPFDEKKWNKIVMAQRERNWVL